MVILEATIPITDWIQAGGVILGVPSAVWGIFTLFRKDKEKEKKIAALEKISIRQAEIVEQLKEQANQMIEQSGLMRFESYQMLQTNKILEKQLELQTNIFLHSKGNEEREKEIEEQKRLDKIRPFFVVHSANSGPVGFGVELDNRGGDAINLIIEPKNSDLVQFNQLPERVNRQTRIMLGGRINASQTSLIPSQVTYDILLTYQDIEGNNYSQSIKKFTNDRYTISDPVMK